MAANLIVEFFLDISTLSRNLNHLIKLNLVNKQISQIDKRSYRINLSNKGLQFYKLFNIAIQNHLEIIYAGINLDEKEQLTEILNKINWQFELNDK